MWDWPMWEWSVWDWLMWRRHMCAHPTGAHPSPEAEPPTWHDSASRWAAHRASSVRTPCEVSVSPCSELPSIVSESSSSGHWAARAPSWISR